MQNKKTTSKPERNLNPDAAVSASAGSPAERRNPDGVIAIIHLYVGGPQKRWEDFGGTLLDVPRAGELIRIVQHADDPCIAEVVAVMLEPGGVSVACVRVADANVDFRDLAMPRAEAALAGYAPKATKPLAIPMHKSASKARVK